ncbi:MAG: hypothetical protein HKN30_10760 [Sulfitobacter sp.]|nr:hypothetical protein [Sulfitobacter sp.]
MKGVVLPALFYALTVFAVGFVLGTIRVLIVVPWIGETAALFAEIPIMIAVSFLVAKWVLSRWPVTPELKPRLAMGLVAFIVLMMCEAAISLTFFGNSFTDHLAHYLKPQAWPGLAGQLLFAAIPALILGVRPN